MPYKAQPIVLEEEKVRKELERRVRATTTAQRDVKRARVILLGADGMASRQISKEVGCTSRTWPCGANDSWSTGSTAWLTLLAPAARAATTTTTG